MIGIEIAFLVGITKIAAIVYMVLQLFVMLVIVRQVMLVTKIIKTMYGFIVLALAFAFDPNINDFCQSAAMKGDVQKKYFIGDNKPGIWSSVYAYKPHNPEFLKKRGEIFAAVTLTGPTTFNVATAGNLLLDHLHETYFENQGDTVLMALEKAILSINKHLQKLLENDDAAETGIDIELTTMVLHNDIACFASTGSGHVYLFRDGNITEISSALG